MKTYLKKINVGIADDEYIMYQEIPKYENGAVNMLNGLTMIDFCVFVRSRVEEEFELLTETTTPRITYIMYVDNYPVGEVAIRPVLNKFWLENSGNIGYKIRPSSRNKGYGNLILSLAIEECKKLNMNEIYIECYDYNVISKKIIIKNGFELVKVIGNVEYYKLNI